MTTSMATALLGAIPGESPESRLAALAIKLGAVYKGSCWRMSPAVRETLRDAAAALALEPPEPHDETADAEWTDVVLAAEARRQAQTAERVTTRFYRMCRGAGRQALFDGQGAVVAQLVAADLPVTPETLAWAASLEDPSVLPTEAPVDPSAVKGGARVDDARGRAGTSRSQPANRPGGRDPRSGDARRRRGRQPAGGSGAARGAHARGTPAGRGQADAGGALAVPSPGSVAG